MLGVRLRIVAAAALALAAACSSEPKPLDVSPRTVEGTLRVVVTGDERFRYEERVPLRIYVAADPRIPKEVRFLSVGIVLPRALADGRGFRVAFDLLGYTKDGEYSFGGEASPGEIEGVPLPEGIASNAFVDLYTPAGARVPIHFYRLGAPCALTVRDGAGSGRLRCPKMADDKGRTVSLLMEWET